jgi:hypothetical protein
MRVTSARGRLDYIGFIAAVAPPGRPTMIRNAFVAIFALILSAGALGGTTAVLDAQVAAPATRIA